MQPSNSNVQSFNLICLHLLSELYESFPVPIAIDPDSLGLSAIPKQLEYDASWDVTKITVETLTFLRQEGFLTAGDPVSSGEFPDVRLTMKGLAILGIPVSLKVNEPQETIINRIKRVMGKGGETIASETVQAVVSEVFKFALSSGAVVTTGIGR